MINQNKQMVATSVNDRLKATARRMSMSPQLAIEFVHARYVYERVLSRLQSTSFSDRWVIKGGVLMLALPQEVHRMTLDLDFAQQEGPKISFTECLNELCLRDPEVEDGLEISLVTEGKDAPKFIREEARNPTLRGKLIVTLCLPRPNERRFIVDVTGAEQDFEPQILMWQPTIKGFEPFNIRAYPWELAFAEKLHSVLTGSINTPRLRDFMDVIAMNDAGVVNPEITQEWLLKVFELREGNLDKLSLDGETLNKKFAATRQKDWEGTLSRTGYTGMMPNSLSDAIEKILAISEPLVRKSEISPNP